MSPTISSVSVLGAGVLGSQIAFQTAIKGFPVTVYDIATSPLWDDHRHLALPHGLRACWSVPMMALDGAVLGTFALAATLIRFSLPLVAGRFKEWQIITAAMLICYDVEFPEMVRAAAIAGADLVIVPTALRRRWSVIAEKLIPVRALENGIFLAYANWAGAEADWDYAGLSVIAGPDGSELARAGDSPQTIIATLDQAAIATIRPQLPYLQDVRIRLSGLN